MRQFGFVQPIPDPPQSLEGVHNKDLRGHRSPVNWTAKYDGWVTMWVHGYQRILEGVPTEDYNPSPEYWAWYTQYASNWIRLSPQLEQPAPQQQQFPMEPPPQYHQFPMQPPPPSPPLYHQFPMEPPQHLQPPPQQAEPSEEIFWSPQRDLWQTFQWDQQPPQPIQPARMSLDVRDISRGSRSREARGRRSVDCSSGSGASRGFLATYDFGIDDAQSIEHPYCNFDLNEEAPIEERHQAPVPEAPIHETPVSEDVYRPEMTTPDYGIASHPMYSPPDQWSVPLMQWAMTQQNLHSTSTSTHAPERESTEDVGGANEVREDEGGEDEAARVDGAGDEGDREARRRGGLLRFLRPLEKLKHPSRFTPSLIKKKKGK